MASSQTPPATFQRIFAASASINRDLFAGKQCFWVATASTVTVTPPFRQITVSLPETPTGPKVIFNSLTRPLSFVSGPADASRSTHLLFDTGVISEACVAPRIFVPVTVCLRPNPRRDESDRKKSICAVPTMSDRMITLILGMSSPARLVVGHLLRVCFAEGRI